MNNYLNYVSKDYLCAEITSLFLHDKDQKQYFNLLTLIEMVPPEQPPSPLLGSLGTRFLLRNSVSERYTVYMARAIELPIEEAIDRFENSQDGIDLKHKDILHAPIEIFENTSLTREPIGDFPLLVNKGNNSLGIFLPERRTGFRVWGMLDMNKPFLNRFDDKSLKKLRKAIASLSMENLNFDLSQFDEHMGNIYLFGCNPYLRKIEFSLLDLNKQLLCQMHYRENLADMVLKLVLQDKRGSNFSFYKEIDLNSHSTIIELPNFPDMLVFTLFDRYGHPIERDENPWDNFSFHIDVAETNLEVETSDGGKLSIPKFSRTAATKKGSFDHSGQRYFAAYDEKRRIASSRERKEFAFFPGDAGDKKKAREYIAAIISKSSERSMLLDPYFSEGALMYAYATSDMGVKVRLLGAAFYLKKKVDKDNPESVTYAERLLMKLNEFRSKLPRQPVECRVLKGGKSCELHDRYIVSDQQVFLLGSSFHEFGGRATTIVRVPAPEAMISKAEEWWGEKFSVKLEEFVAQQKTKK